MRYILTRFSILAFLYVLTFDALCQTINTDCVGQMRGILTVPGSGSVNNEVPSKRNNTLFDWTQSTYNVYTSTLSPNANTIPSPFYQSDNAPINHLLDNKDMLPSDGWELIKRDMGYADNGTAQVTTIVYMVLYNKYTSVMRVFFAGPVQGYNGAKMQVKFLSATQTSSVLRATTNFYALDQQDPDVAPSLQTVTGYPNDIMKWFYADFHLGYDPCTCVFESKMTIQLFLINNSVINITGTETGTLTSISNNNTGGVSPDNRYSFKDLTSEAKKVSESYKSLNEFKDKLYKSASVPTNTQQQSQPQQEKAVIFDKFSNLLKSSDLLKAGLNVVPYVGAAVELFNFFTAGGKKSPQPQEVKLMPMAMNSTIDLQGTLSVTQSFKDITFFTPGSKGSETGALSDYPFYNEILGVFNIIETPKLYVGNYTTATVSEIGTPGDPNYTHIVDNEAPIQFVPASDGSILSYVLNPAARFKANNVEMFGQLLFGFNVAAVAGGNGTPPVAAHFEVVYQTQMMPIEALSNMKINGGYRRETDQFGTRDTSLPTKPAVPEAARLRLFVNLERQDADANTQNVLTVLEYPMIVETNGSYSYSALEYTAISGEILHNSYTIPTTNETALTSIDFGTNVTTGSGVTATFKAPQITLSPGTTISGVGSSTVRLTGGFPVPGAAVVSGAANNTVKTFCASSTYANNHQSARIAADDLAFDEVNENQIFRISPNPTPDMVYARYYVGSDTDVEIQVRDITGRVIGKFNQGYKTTGAYEANFEVTSLPVGMYFFVLKTATVTHAEKLMVQR